MAIFYRLSRHMNVPSLDCGCAKEVGILFGALNQLFSLVNHRLLSKLLRPIRTQLQSLGVPCNNFYPSGPAVTDCIHADLSFLTVIPSFELERLQDISQTMALLKGLTDGL